MGRPVAEGKIGLENVPLGKALTQARRRLGRPSDEQQTRDPAVETVNQVRAAPPVSGSEPLGSHADRGGFTRVVRLREQARWPVVNHAVRGTYDTPEAGTVRGIPGASCPVPPDVYGGLGTYVSAGPLAC